jgi:hypothetical protein
MSNAASPAATTTPLETMTHYSSMAGHAAAFSYDYPTPPLVQRCGHHCKFIISGRRKVAGFIAW